ncbi:hypothetical protein D3C78_1766090 [compost metagenome]
MKNGSQWLPFFYTAINAYSAASGSVKMSRLPKGSVTVTSRQPQGMVSMAGLALG